MRKYFTYLILYLIIAGFLKQVYMQQCSLCVPVLQYKCKQCRNFCPQYDMESIQKCSHPYCPKQQQNLCQTYEYGDNPLIITQQICLRQCCPTDKTVMESIQKCFLQNEIQALKPLIIISVVLIILGIGAIVCCCYKKIQKRFKTISKVKVNVVRPQPDITIIQINHQCNIIQQFIQQNSCSICLQDKINTITACGHHFHFKCLGQWINRSNCCPMCKNISFDPVEYICQKCSKQSLKIYAKKIVQENSYKIPIQNLKCLNCSNS